MVIFQVFSGNHLVEPSQTTRRFLRRGSVLPVGIYEMSSNQMASDEDMKAEIDRLRAENEELKKPASDDNEILATDLDRAGVRFPFYQSRIFMDLLSRQ